MAMLSSSQFNLLYPSTYQGDDQGIVELLQRCESLCATIASGTSAEGLRQGVRILDACLVPTLPASEVRNIVKTVIDKDVSLINEMPEVRRMLWRVVKAIEISELLDPRVLNRINADLTGRGRRMS